MGFGPSSMTSYLCVFGKISPLLWAMFSCVCKMYTGQYQLGYHPVLEGEVWGVAGLPLQPVQTLPNSPLSLRISSGY
jgi:hypothetical protein